MNSTFLKLNLKDLGKGVLVAIGTAVLTAVIPLLQTGKLPNIEELRVVGVSAIAAGLVYLLKNLFTNSDGELAKKEIETPKAGV